MVRQLAESAAEDQDLEFKAGALFLGTKAASHLSKAVSAFANGRGGVILLGVTDRPPRDLDGVVVDSETVKQVNDKIKLYPRLEYPTPQVVHTGEGRGVVIVQIPRGTDGPYASMANGMPEFYVRTHSGSEPMPWPAIRDGMVRADERRRQGELLLNQFEQHYMTAKNLREGAREQHDFPITDSFDLTLTHMAVAAIHPWLSKDIHAANDVARLVGRMNHINGQVQAMIASVAVDPRRLPAWRGRMGNVLGSFRDQLVQAEAGLRRVLQQPDADYRQKYPEWW